MKPATVIFFIIAMLNGCVQAPSSEMPSPHPAIITRVATAGSESIDTQPVAAGSLSSTLPAAWFNQAVFMEIYIRGYQDSDGDGIGDFNGLTSRLDYLADLGIRGIWLMPMMKSQDRDHGYAIMDYRAVEPDYGSEADFKRLLDEAHKRGIGIIIDYVINHSSAQNPLFYDSKRGLAGKRDWYMWRKDNPSWVNWWRMPTWHRTPNGYYYGVFWQGMPDFNLRSDSVVAYHQDSLRHWLNMGVDGFRFDAVGTLFENGPTAYLNQPENHRFLLEQLQPTVHAYQHRYMVCENPDGAVRTAVSCGSSFYFGFNHSILSSVNHGKVSPNLIPQITQAPMEKMATILANHDTFAGDRIIHQLDGSQSKYQLAAASMMLMPGIPFLYYGEEIGMGHSAVIDHDRDHRLRAPMSWNGNIPTVGFTQGIPFRAAAKNAPQYNVEEQLVRHDSLLNYYRRVIALRNDNSALQQGSFKVLQSNNDSVLSFTREDKKQSLVVAINYSEDQQTIHHPIYHRCLTPLFGHAVKQGKDGIALNGRSVQVYQLCD